jgi:hypothetical protein
MSHVQHLTVFKTERSFPGMRHKCGVGDYFVNKAKIPEAFSRSFEAIARRISEGSTGSTGSAGT